MSRGTLGLIGAGKVGPALARLLRAAGWEAGPVADRDREAAERAIAFIGGGRIADRNADVPAEADLLLVAVPDGAIAAVAAEAAAGRARPGALALHFSGALSSEVLAPLRSAGASVGSLHPLQSFADSESAARRIRESFLFYEGDEPDRIRAVAEDLGGRPVPIEKDAKVLYHAGAAAACNLAVALIDVGVRLLVRAGIDAEDALEALLPLIRGTVGNLEEVGLPAALTGPVRRGDEETVRAHVEAIRNAAPELLAAYVAASRHAAAMAGTDLGDALSDPTRDG